MVLRSFNYVLILTVALFLGPLGCDDDSDGSGSGSGGAAGAGGAAGSGGSGGADAGDLAAACARVCELSSACTEEDPSCLTSCAENFADADANELIRCGETHLGNGMCDLQAAGECILASNGLFRFSNDVIDLIRTNQFT